MKNTALFKVINETRINLKFRALSQNVTNTYTAALSQTW